MAEYCVQCLFTIEKAKIEEFCGYMGELHPYYILECAGCGKTIVDQRGRCCAKNCTEDHGGRWWLTFQLPGILLKVYDPDTGQSLVGKDEDV